MVKNALAPKEKKTEVVTRTYQYKGPLPHPTILNQFDPQTRKVIVMMANRQSVHRQSLEKAIVTSNISNEKNGMWISAVITCLMIVCGTYLLLNNKNTEGLFLTFGPAIFQAANYIYHKKRELDAKSESSTQSRKK